MIKLTSLFESPTLDFKKSLGLFLEGDFRGLLPVSGTLNLPWGTPHTTETRRRRASNFTIFPTLNNPEFIFGWKVLQKNMFIWLWIRCLNKHEQYFLILFRHHMVRLAFVKKLKLLTKKSKKQMINRRICLKWLNCCEKLQSKI